MGPGNRAEQILDGVSLEDSEPGFLPCVTLRVEFANGYLLPSRIVVNKNLYDAFDIVLDGFQF